MRNERTVLLARGPAGRTTRGDRFLSQRSDVDRIGAYANELDELAEEMERLAEGKGRARV